MRLAAARALIGALVLLGLPPVAAHAQPHAVIAFLPPGAGETRPLVEEFAARGLAIGMTSPTVGGFKARQMGLDMSQGTRIPTRLYSGPIGSLRLRRGRLDGWGLALRRAKRAPGDLKPGLLGQTIERAGRRVGYRQLGAGYSVAAIVAADALGEVHPAQASDALDVYALAGGRRGLRQLDRLLSTRPGFLYVVRAPYGSLLRLLPSGLRAPGVTGQLRSATTRRTGLIAATDVAPSVLRYLGIPVPDAMQGEAIEGRGGVDPKAVERLTKRLAVVTARRGDVLLWIAAAWLVTLALLCIAGGRPGLRTGLRAGLLAVLWIPGLTLLTAALQPGREAEAAIVAGGAMLLALATDRLAPWPRGPALPALVVFAAHAIDLARGSPLIGESLAGPNPAGGARFFGIGNELEAMLSLAVLIGTGAALARPGGGPQAARPALAFAGTSFVAAAIMGAGRFGADVGAVITLGAGGAAAVIAALPGRPSRRAIALGIAAPAAAVLALIVVDLVTGGGAHLTRSVLHAHGSGDLVDVVRRRFSGSFSTLGKPGWAISFALAVLVIVWLAARGRAVLATLPQPFAAGLVGAWFAAVVGALANDSGPLILDIGALILLLAYAYARARPKVETSRADG